MPELTGRRGNEHGYLELNVRDGFVGDSKDILGMRVAVVSRAEAVHQVATWALEKQGRYVCVANVHMCMESFDDASFRSVVNSADLTVPDGLPLVWAQRMLGASSACQVRGADLTLDICAMAEERQIAVAIFGSTYEVLGAFSNALLDRFPRLQINYAVAPPFRSITAEEDQAYMDGINSSGARILLVGLGCPKQEVWMAAHRDRLTAVMLGVGAAFDFIAGSKRAAPRWMQKIGLEWLFRLSAEPRRLWKRYLQQNPRFVWHFFRQLVGRQAPTNR